MEGWTIMKVETIKFRMKTGWIQFRYDLNQTISFVLKIAVGVALGITLANIAAPFLGL